MLLLGQAMSSFSLLAQLSNGSVKAVDNGDSKVNGETGPLGGIVTQPCVYVGDGYFRSKACSKYVWCLSQQRPSSFKLLEKIII